MIDEQNQETGAESETGAEEGTEDVVTLKKDEYAKLNETIGSLKRDLKDLKKAKTEETSQKTEKIERLESKSDAKLLEKLEKMALRQAGIVHADDIELAHKTAQKWGVDIDEVLGDEDFKVKLERQQTSRANADATSNIKGGAGASAIHNTTEYWKAKNEPPDPRVVTDRKTRAKIVREMMTSSKTGGKTFYND